MSDINLDKLNPDAAKKIRPFLHDILDRYPENIHSIHVTGTAVTADYDGKISDVNSIIVLKEMDLKFLGVLAPLGKKYGKHKVAAPLIMTPGYIERSLDVFPVEFLNFRLIHSTVFGEDILEGLEIDRMDLRHQCERELKVKLIWLRQGYISSRGDSRILAEQLVNSITGCIPLFRGIIVLRGKEPPVAHREVITALSGAVDIDTGVFIKLLERKHDRQKVSPGELNTIFEEYYTATEKLGRTVNEIKE